MFFLQKGFYDKYGNFNNSKFVKLLAQSKKEQKNKTKRKYGNLNIEITIFNSVSKKELWQFINKLSIFINSGVDIKGALNILTSQIKNPYLKKITTEMKEDIDHGITISDTMQQYPKVFDPLTTSLIGVGETTGKLGNILEEIDTHLLENIELKGRVKGAMIYPIILLLLTFIMVIFMMVFVVPRITKSFERTGNELPTLTQYVVNISQFFLNDWGKIILAIIIIIILAKIIKFTYTGRILFANLYTKIPIFGYVVRQSNIIYFIHAFTTLLNAGVLLLEAIKTASKVVPNLAYKKEIIKIKNEVEVGITISKSLGLDLSYESSVYLNKLFPEEFAYVVNTGEETGSLSESLRKIGNNYSRELKRYIGNLSSMMEPTIIIIVGFFVGTIVIAVMLPFFEMGKIAQSL